jgi:chemotaxis protein MotB
VSGGGARRGHGRRGGHEEEHEEHENHERWLVSYADMVTLLMVLFIVMFAISSLNQGKFEQLKQGLRTGFASPVAVLDGGSPLLSGGGAAVGDVAPIDQAGQGRAGAPQRTLWKPGSEEELRRTADLVKATQRAQVEKEVADLKKAERALKAALARAGVPRGATFRFDERGLVVTVATDEVLFESGSAVLRPQGRRILDALTPTLARLPNRLTVDGHTNWLPIASDRYPSNWELSTDRATGVLRYMVRNGVPGGRVAATGYADTHPLRPRSDPRALVVNRRVEIVVLAAIDDAAGRAIAALGNDDRSDEEARR